MQMFDERDEVLVIGVGRSGLAVAQTLRDRNIRVSAYDDRPGAELAPEIARLAGLGVVLVNAEELARAGRRFSAAVISPGVPPSNPAVIGLRSDGVPIYSEIEVAYRMSAAPMIAVTGTKGKSTTTALIAHILRTAGASVRMGGNIGNPLIREAVATTPKDWLVAEISSFQLEGVDRFAPRVSVLLNLSADHLDRYESLEEYANAKFRIFANQGPGDSLVVNADDPYCRRLGDSRDIRADVVWFSERGDPIALVGMIDGAIALRGTDPEDLATLARPGDLRLRGAHNMANAMAASVAAMRAGAPVGAVRAGLRSFEPLAHRLSTVASFDGVEWIDDSKATNPEAVVRALDAFTAPIVLIAGGRSKATDFAPLGAAAMRRCKAVALIGEAAEEIGSHLGGVPVHRAFDLGDAVEYAASVAVAGDVVLLSPGCASFDMFANAEERGDIFAHLAHDRSRGARST
jgi:UDP-N-acetylmuramoylalanine--D-glutamate ligase